MAGRSKLTSRAMTASDPDDPQEDGYPVKRRALQRAFAVALALAAISPLFAADPDGCARSCTQTRSARQIRPSQMLEHPHH